MFLYPFIPPFIPIPPVKGSKYQSKEDPNDIIEFSSSEGECGESTVFVFNSPSGVIKIKRTEFTLKYKIYNDPWASQKAFAKQHGFIWQDEALPPTRD